MAQAVTVLRCDPSLVLAKTWTADGTIAPYGQVRTFSIASQGVEGIAALSTLLTQLEGDPRACIIRGGLKPDAIPEEGGRYRRTKENFADAPRQWLALDIDDFTPLGADPLDQPQEAIEEFLQAHLPEWGTASFHWQLTGSAGRPDAQGKLKARAWFWLEAPRTSGQLKAWAKHRWPKPSKPPFDIALFSATQIHYTAAPIFEAGVSDPVAVRSGFKEGTREAVSVPLVEEPTYQRGQPVAPASGGEMTPYVRRSLDGIYNDITEAMEGERNRVLYRKAYRAFSFVHTGQAEEGEVRQGLKAAALAAGLDEEEAGATLASAWSASQKAPDDVAPSAGDGFEAECSTEGGIGGVLTLRDAEDSQEAPRKATEGGGRPPFGYTLVGDLVGRLKPIAWLVKGFLEADSLGLIYGPPKSGKSFLAIDWACCVATGTPWNGHEVKQGAVFYLAGEGHTGLARRFAAWEQAKGVSLKGAPLAVSNKAAPLTDRNAAGQVLRAIEEMAQDTNRAPAIVVVDTLARNFGADENSTEDMGRFVQHLDEIRANWRCTALVVHHTGKDEGRGARGNSSLPGAIDAGYLVKRDATGSVTLTPTEMKDADLPPPIYFTLESVKLPLVDEDGGDVFGACLVPEDAPAMPTRGRKPGKNQTTALAKLTELSQEREAEALRAGAPPAPVWVDIEEWRQACRETVDRRRWPGVLSSLEEAGSIQVVGQHVRYGGLPSTPAGGGINKSAAHVGVASTSSPGAGCPIRPAPLGGPDRTGHPPEAPTGQTGCKPAVNRTLNRTFRQPQPGVRRKTKPDIEPDVFSPPPGRQRKAPPGERRDDSGEYDYLL
ncbi:AAA family ATPase [Halomonas sp. GXIMD04776]|uniref:AAA family ATPase n=1 Tax=Halomonas sp. GXIMD04776 TaxID=3415605 RepID=UPI003CA30950